MKKLLSTIAFTFVGIHASLFATARPAPCNFAFTGEWVYYTPVYTGSLWAFIQASSTSPVNGAAQFNEPCYESGFRIQGMYGFGNCCADVRVAWTSYFQKAIDRAQATDDLRLFPTRMDGGPTTSGILNGDGESRIDFSLNRVEGLFGAHVYDKCDLCLTLEGGLQYSRLKANTRNIFNNPTAANPPAFTQSIESEYWGIGPQIGLDATYTVWDCLAFTGTTSSALLVGENAAKSRQVLAIAGPPNDISWKSPWNLVPSIQMRLGMSYAICGWIVEAGYEYLTYINAMQVIEPLGTTVTSTTQVENDLSFHGPYASASFCF